MAHDIAAHFERDIYILTYTYVYTYIHTSTHINKCIHTNILACIHTVTSPGLSYMHVTKIL